ncbi:unnamed protein product, partial [Didymodactylos carnosus]
SEGSCETPINESIEETQSEIVDALNNVQQRLSSLYNHQQQQHPLAQDTFFKSTASGSENESDEQEGDVLLDSGHSIPFYNNIKEVPSTSTPTTTGDTIVVEQKPSTVAVDNEKKIKSKRHIMISYNHATSSEICTEIASRLRTLDYNVWMDTPDLRGDILDGMAWAVENSFAVLLCINDAYYHSYYCKKEAAYTVEKRIAYVPCMMEADYICEGWLGFIKGSLIHIEFAKDPFEKAFQSLVDEIKHIESKLPVTDYDDRKTSQTIQSKFCRHTRTFRFAISILQQSTITVTSDPITTTSLFNANSTATVQPKCCSTSITVSDFDQIIRDYKRSINLKANKNIRKLKRSELRPLIRKLRQELFRRQDSNSSSTTTATDSDNEETTLAATVENQLLIQSLLKHTLNAQDTLSSTVFNQQELISRIVDRLITTTPPSSPSKELSTSPCPSSETYIRLLLVVLIVWTIKMIFIQTTTAQNEKE